MFDAGVSLCAMQIVVDTEESDHQDSQNHHEQGKLCDFAHGACRLMLTHRFPAGCQPKNMTSFMGGWHAFMDAIAVAADGTFAPYVDEREIAAGYRERLDDATG